MGIKANNKQALFGVSGLPDNKGNGNKAENYAAFIDNELYAFIKKRAGVRKFNSVVIGGSETGGLSAFDIAWNHADKIDKVGVFSGAFQYTNTSVKNPAYADSTSKLFLNQIKSSRKKPRLQYWFYGDYADETSIQHKDSIQINYTKDLIEIIKSKKVCPPGDIVYFEHREGKQDHKTWSKVFPDFLIWAFATK